jgi:hypothetical protein
MVHKEIKQKTHLRLRERNIATRPIQSGVICAQAVQGKTEIPQTNLHICTVHQQYQKHFLLFQLMHTVIKKSQNVKTI